MALKLFLLHFLFGICSAGHLSNGFQERWSTNKYWKKPAKWTEEYIDYSILKGIESFTIVNKTEEWPGVNDYYKFFIDKYPAYVKSSDFVPLTKMPDRYNKYGNEIKGVCMNFQMLVPGDNTSVLGLYTCPLAFEPPQHGACCGNDYAEYCCEPEVNILPGLIGGPVLIGPVALFLFFYAIYHCTCKKNTKSVPGPDHEPITEVAVSGAASDLGDKYKSDYGPSLS